MSFQCYNTTTTNTVMWILLFLFNVSATNPWPRKRCVLLSGFDTIYSCIQKLLNGYEIEIHLVTKVLLNVSLDFTLIKIWFQSFENNSKCWYWQECLYFPEMSLGSFDFYYVFLYLIHSKKQLLLSLQWHFYTQHKRGHCSMLLHYVLLYHLLLGKRGKRMPV